MLVETTATRLKMLMKKYNLKQVDILKMTQPYSKKFGVKVTKSDLSQFVSGKVTPGQHKLFILCLALNVSEPWLMGYDVPMERDAPTPNKTLKLVDNLPSPEITENYTTFPVIGEIAAGYNHIAYEDWEGETVDIPDSYLRGRKKEEFFVLRVKGSSMYPLYHDGDRVLILKQNTMNYSGEVGAVIYDGDCGTLKKVEYVDGEDWMRLVPINPTYEPELIEGERLETCRVVGIPKLLLRDL